MEVAKKQSETLFFGLIASMLSAARFMHPVSMRDKETDMTTQEQVSSRWPALGMTSLALGFLGLVLFWWVPFGIIASLAGLSVGIAGWLMRPGTRN
jgi:hypothetical protein